MHETESELKQKGLFIFGFEQMTGQSVDEQQKGKDKRPVWRRQEFHWEAKGRKMFLETRDF